ncbi:LmeA family phospholipid-binding protein, partial [Mycobacterium tuberculosis]|nr:LmeA family phospholipid-binding protein [Mycobacterium tuberculosis]
MTTREYARPRSRRRTLIVSGIVVVLTLIVGAIAADRIVDSLTEQRIAEGLKSYGETEVDVEGFPVLTQLAAGRLDAVRVTAA